MKCELFYAQVKDRVRRGNVIPPLDNKLRESQFRNAQTLDRDLRKNLAFYDGGCEQVMLEALARWPTFSAYLVEQMIVYGPDTSEARRAYAGLLQHNHVIIPDVETENYVIEYLEQNTKLPNDLATYAAFVGYKLAYYPYDLSDGHAVGIIPKTYVPDDLQTVYNLRQRNQYIMVDILDERILFGITESELRSEIKRIGPNKNMFEIEALYTAIDPVGLISQFTPAVLGLTFA